MFKGLKLTLKGIKKSRVKTRRNPETNFPTRATLASVPLAIPVVGSPHQQPSIAC